jgi:hypothetical protein
MIIPSGNRSRKVPLELNHLALALLLASQLEMLRSFNRNLKRKHFMSLELWHWIRIDRNTVPDSSKKHSNTGHILKISFKFEIKNYKHIVTKIENFLPFIYNF